MIAEEVPDWRDRLFYVSGSRGMVEHVKNELRQLGVTPTMVRTDFFPGYVR